jgi:TRAP-type C4-dicarboxylate transport system permease small subunit
MKEFIRGVPRRSIVGFFGTLYALALLFALFPPLYLWGSGIRFEILGIPFAIMYWIVNALVLGLTLTAFYVVEDIRGELDDDSTEPDSNAPVTGSLGG